MAEHVEQNTPGLLARLEAGPVVCAEGYVFELERRGYLQAGAFVPEVVLDHPEALAQLHRDFVHAGSDVVEALTYYAHREKLRMVGKEQLLEQLNREALRIAGGIARETGTLLAGDICNTNVYLGDAETAGQARAMFEEQVGWAAEAGVDFIIAETFSYGGEALLALEVIKAAGLPAVVTMAMPQDPVTREGWSAAEVCARLEDAGADVVGLNCFRGPRTMLPLLREIRGAVRGHIAALPVPYRTHEEEPTFQSLRDHSGAPVPGGMPFPTALDPFLCNRYEMGEFARQAYEIGVRYLGICCGAGPHHIRSMAEALGKQPAGSRYTADMSKHAYFGTNPLVKRENQEFSKQL